MADKKDVNINQEDDILAKPEQSGGFFSALFNMKTKKKSTRILTAVLYIALLITVVIVILLNI